MIFDIQFFGGSGASSGINRGKGGNTTPPKTTPKSNPTNIEEYNDIKKVSGAHYNGSGRLEFFHPEARQALLKEIAKKATEGTKFTTTTTVGKMTITEKYEVTSRKGKKVITGENGKSVSYTRKQYVFSVKNLSTVVGAAEKLVIKYPNKKEE